MNTPISRPASSLAQWRELIREAPKLDEARVVQERIAQIDLDESVREQITASAVALVETLRKSTQPGLMESMLAEYGLSDEEGLALMCLAEAYLRVPDTTTIDALIRDKIGQGQWTRHAGAAQSMLVNASTWGLILSGEVFRPASGTGAGDEPGGSLGVVQKLKQRVGEPVVRLGVGAAMKAMGQQFVLGRTIDEAIDRSTQARRDGYRFSFDMLGEAARTDDAAHRYFDSYAGAIKALAARAKPDADVFDNPGISVKLSALHPRYERQQADVVMTELVPRVSELARMAARANIGFNIDAEEANRLDISLDVIEAVLRDPELRGWDGFGIVVQAYAKACLPVLNWFYELAKSLNTRVAVRLVKGAYWDMEIKQAQTLGLPAFPVFTRRASTDVSYLAGTRFLLEHADTIYPQFASHNAQTVVSVAAMAEHLNVPASTRYEYQRLHGMGESLHKEVLADSGRICRVYAPVGEHEDLLAYLVRRMLENGANSSFVNQLMDESVAPADLVADPVSKILEETTIANARIPLPQNLYKPTRANSFGWDINDAADDAHLNELIAPYQATQWRSAPMVQGLDVGSIAEDPAPILNPVNHADQVGQVQATKPEAAGQLVSIAQSAQPTWAALDAAARATIIEAVADAYEANAGELLAILIREAGKNRLDAVAEIREAVDFCRYYAQQARDTEVSGHPASGVFVCISPWNFPLAIYTGQIVAALVTGNAVIAKPADQTPLIAARAVQLMHGAGVPLGVLSLAPGSGAGIGAALCAVANIDGVCFTGSTNTAQHIDRALAASSPSARLIAETGGLNAMIVDSTALPEACVRDIVQSAFQSAGQRCSALRVLFVQEDVADDLLEMLAGATARLRVGDPAHPATDVGPLIDETAHQRISAYCESRDAAGQRLFGGETVAELRSQQRLTLMSGEPDEQRVKALAAQLLAPVAYEISAISELESEIFGPVLHVVRFAADAIDDVIEQINATGYGLTFGLQSRIDLRVKHVCRKIRAGNAYVNRNQIGAVVGVQPFGGEGLSGTGPKAGGPHYLSAFCKDLQAVLPISTGVVPETASDDESNALLGNKISQNLLTDYESLAQDRLTALLANVKQLPAPWQSKTAAWLAQSMLLLDEDLLDGPTGETNRLRLVPRGVLLCLGADQATEPAQSLSIARLASQAIKALAMGNAAVLTGVARGEVARLLKPWLVAAGLPDTWLLQADETTAWALLSQNDSAPAPLGGVLSDENGPNWVTLRVALAKRAGARVPVFETDAALHRFGLERVITIDTTASGGNASLLTLDSEPLESVG
ncbi:MAG: bifunctional proline dehydrogenase/L-glutamate gamma-semialdehyde dehydrogenase PutA [Burkholderiaceae bacterium]